MAEPAGDRRTEATSAFALRVGDDGLATLVFDLPGRSVNLFTFDVIDELEALVDELAARSDIDCLVLLSGKERSFIAGADVEAIAEIDDGAVAESHARRGQALFQAWSELPFPTVAAVRGACMGGGTELCLASTYIVSSDRDDVRIGLPEIKLGILPGWGGCTRLPRRVGIENALDLILAGRAVSGKKALRIGLVDALMPEARFLPEVRRFADERRGARRRPRQWPDAKTILLEKNPLGRKILFDQARKRTLSRTDGHYPAPLRALEVVQTGVEKGMIAGLVAEAEAIGELATSEVSKNLVHVFLLNERAKKRPGVPGGEAREVERVAVVGAGVMGGGIAQLIAYEAGLPVRLKDIEPEGLAGGMAHASDMFEKLVRKQKLRQPEAERRLALLRPALDFTGFSRCELMIEAVVENLEVKQLVFADCAEQLPDDAVLATNTSSLSIDEIGAEVPDPGRVVGMHFFNPVHKMPLVEVVVGETTSPAAANTVFEFARRLGKTPIVVDDRPGFLVNRLLGFYLTEALWLLDEGYRIETVDETMDDWGMPMGPIALTDEVGIDVAMEVAGILSEAFGERLPRPPWVARLRDSDRLGAKNERGFYRYEDGERTEPDPKVRRLLGLPAREPETPRRALVDRMVLPMVDEAARCLAEGVVDGAGALDLALIMGTGFPPFRGGLCRWADHRGLGEVVSTLEGLARQIGERHEPSEALRDAAEAGGLYARYGD